MSSVGVLAAPLATDGVRSRLEPVDDETLDARRAAVRRARGEGRARSCSHSGVTDITHERSIDMRYVGQGFEVTRPGHARRGPQGRVRGRVHPLARPQGPGRADRGDQLARRSTRGPDPDLRLVAAPAGDGDALKGSARCLLRATAYVETADLRPLHDVRRRARSTARRSSRSASPRPSSAPGATAARRRGRQPDHGDRPDGPPVTVGIAAGRLNSILDEQQATLVRTAFSTIVRESEDLACGVFDRARPDDRPVADAARPATSTRWRPASSTSSTRSRPRRSTRATC